MPQKQSVSIFLNALSISVSRKTHLIVSPAITSPINTINGSVTRIFFLNFPTPRRPTPPWAITTAAPWRGEHHHVGGYSDTEKVRTLLEKSKIKLLDNSATQLNLRNWKLNLAGLGDVWAKEFLPEKTFKELSPENATATVVLSHNPDTKDALKNYRWDLLLCGHTHGGQVRLPFVGAPIAPVKDKRFVQGLHRWDNRWIYTTKGVGNLYGIRVNCRPEVSLLTLV